MIIAANFKACKTRTQTQSYFDEVNDYLRESDNENESIVFVPASTFMHTLNGATLGAQNAYPVVNGAYTGETALDHLDEFGIKTILIGHSERRQTLGESQEEIARKFAFFKEQGFRICYCIGEPLEVKEQGHDAVISYLEKELVGIDLAYENMMVAYEPIWAIGTGLTPTNDEIDAILHDVKTKTSKDVLYGGSVKTANVKEILSLKNCDGVLVGSAALIAKDYIMMLQTAKEVQ
jgi:triosephosphate isomerase (TIM)